MWEVTMVAAGASVQDLLWDSAGGGAPRGWCTWGFLHVHVTPPRCFPLARWSRAHVPLPEACGYLQVSAAPPVASLRVATLLLAPLWSAIPFSP